MRTLLISVAVWEGRISNIPSSRRTSRHRSEERRKHDILLHSKEFPNTLHEQMIDFRIADEMCDKTASQMQRAREGEE